MASLSPICSDDSHRDRHSFHTEKLSGHHPYTPAQYVPMSQTTRSQSYSPPVGPNTPRSRVATHDYDTKRRLEFEIFWTTYDLDELRGDYRACLHKIEWVEREKEEALKIINKV